MGRERPITTMEKNNEKHDVMKLKIRSFLKLEIEKVPCIDMFLKFRRHAKTPTEKWQTKQHCFKVRPFFTCSLAFLNLVIRN